MPLEKSASKPAFVRNLKAELSADKPRNQALAIAYSVMRKAKKRRADGGDVSQDDAPPPKANLLDQAKAQYPVLKDLDYGYVENYRPNAGFLEHWNPGDAGAEPNSPTSLDALRPKEIPIDKPGLEIRDPNTRPIDVLGDIASHHLIDSDPVVKQAYQNLQTSMTPHQQAILQDQYQYAVKNEGETGAFDDWKQRAGMPGFFRGYTFQQWPKEFNDSAYTPEQMKALDGLMNYFQTGVPPKDGRAYGGKARNPAIANALKFAKRASALRRADGGEALSDADQAAMMPETYANPAVDHLIRNAAAIPKRAIEAAANYQPGQPETYDPAPIVDAAMLPMGTGAIAGVPVRAGEAVLGAGPIRAYHGSPHDFDKFSLDKIGTGEGAQAYGHGLYFAENEGVAKQYEKALSAAKDLPSDVLAQYYEPGRIVPGYSGLDLVKKYDPSNRAVTVRSVDKDGNPTQDLLGLRDRVHTTQPTVAEVNRAFKERGLPEYKPGKMYEVHINADPEHFLDWDKPLAQQSDAVKQALEPHFDKYYSGVNKTHEAMGDLPAPSREEVANQISGSEALRSIFGGKNYKVGDREGAAQQLRDAGIPGIKYLDQGSRSAGEGSRNYVVFNDKLVNILRKYGIAGLPAAQIAAEATQEDKGHATGGAVRNAVRQALAVAKRAKGGAVHVGPIKGDEGGRTDVHEMAVPDGAYVLPADFISHLGESNSQAGLKKAQEHFGDPPKRNAGGAVKPVDCITAAGEFVISPAKVKEIGKGDLEFGHKVLDRLVMSMRKDHIHTLAGLPEPAKD